MECTQRLECLTQELYESRQERTSNEQIGFLGICGKKYPVMKGPNKIGRDPQTCNIVLDLNSVSRQHAVINILNSTEYMIMDLDSANKTKLLNRTLPPYMPHPLKNGDTVQFGLIFGIFRLLEEDDELPMTQALDIPDTPVVNRHITKINNLPSTTIPESPDCSDKDESFIVSSQSTKQDEFKSPSSHYIKASSKTIAIQPIGINKIDNAYWKSAKKSVSIDMGLDESNEDPVSPAKSVTTAGTVVNNNIHEMDTQVPFTTEAHEASDAIHTANTQLFTNNPSISGLDTHAIKMNNLPESKKINKQQDMKLDLCTENKENNNCIYNAETQIFGVNDATEAKKQINNKNIEETKKESLNPELNISDEEIIFDEIDSPLLEEDFDSQPLLPAETLNIDENIIESNHENISNNTNSHFNDKQMIRARLNSDSSTDCEDFDLLPTQKIQENPVYDIKDKITDNSVFKSHKILTNINDDSTDCEDNAMEVNEKVNPIKCSNIFVDDNDSTDCEDNVISSNLEKRKEANEGFEDLATQVIAMDVPNENDDVKDKPESDLSFEDMPTQVIETVDMQNTSKKSDDIYFEPTQVLPINVHDEILEQNRNSEKNIPFKVPLQYKKRNKKNEIIKTNVINPVNTNLEDDNFYNATQEIFNDLCTQNESLTESKQSKVSNSNLETKNDHFIDKTQKLIKKTHIIVHKSTEINDGDDKFNNLETSLLSEDKDNVSKHEQNSNKSFSDSSDVEGTPKKPIKFMETFLPNSQEIKKSVRLKTAKTFAESPSDSEQEHDEEKDYTPIISRKIKTNKNAKTDLTKKFETELLPTRVLTRVRKPTVKFQNSNMGMNNMMKNSFLTEPEENIDTEIITENILRLKAKASKNKMDGEIKKSRKTKSEDKQSHEVQNDMKDFVKQLPITINRKESDEKIDSKRKSNESGKYGNEKSKKDNNNQKNNKSKKENNNLRTSETKSLNEKKPIDVKRDDTMRTHSKVKEDVQKSDKKSEKSSRRSPRTRGSAQVDEKQEKISESSKNKAPAKHANKQKDEDTKRSSKEKISISDRSTRSKGKEQSGKKNESKPSTSDRTQSSDNKKRKLNIDDENRKESPSEKEMVRSKRQKTMKNYLEPKPEKSSLSSIIDSKRKQNGQSTVYSLSSESGVDSPKEKSLKRSAKSDEFNNIKISSASKLVSNTSLRESPRNIKTHKVLLTAFPYEKVEVKLIKMGAVIVNEVAECTVVLTLQIKRTFKTLCAIGLGKPIVGPSWVQACVDTNMFVDPWMYIIKDDSSEKEFNYQLLRTLTGKRNYLKGYNVSSTPSVVPIATEMKYKVTAHNNTVPDAKHPALRCACHPEISDGLSFFPVISLASLPVKPEHSSACTLLLGGRISGNAVVPPQSDSARVLPLTIVECSGGTWKEGGSKWICVSCQADKTLWQSLKRKGAILVNKEFVLKGVLQQRLDFEKHRICC